VQTQQEGFHKAGGLLRSVFGAVKHTDHAIASATKTAIESSAKSVANNGLDSINHIVFAPLVALDAVAHTHTVKAIKDLESGAADEVIHHPGTVLKEAAIGAGIAALTVATGGGFAAGLAIGAGAMAATELIKNRHNGLKGEIDGAIHDGKNMLGACIDWSKDAVLVSSNGQHSEAETERAEKGLRSAGAFGADTAAGIAGGIAGGACASWAGFDHAIPDLFKSPEARVDAAACPGETRIQIHDRREIAKDFYTKEGFSGHLLKSHLKGTDFHEPVREIEIPKGTVLKQYQAVAGKQGDYYVTKDFSDLEIPKLGIQPYGLDASHHIVLKTPQEFVTDTNISALNSIAAPIRDVWSIPGMKFKMPGGASQFFCVEREHIRPWA
jgi:hypothetical protein